MQTTEIFKKPGFVIFIMIVLLGGLAYGIKKMDAMNAHSHGEEGTHSH